MLYTEKLYLDVLPWAPMRYMTTTNKLNDYNGRKRHRNSEAGYEIKFESTTIDFAAMSNRC